MKSDLFKKLPLASLIFATAFLILATAVLGWLLQEIGRNRAAVTEAELALGSQISGRDETASVSRFLGEIKEAKAELEAHFAASSDVVPFLDAVERLAPLAGAEAEVALLNVLPDKTSLLVEVKAVGAFPELYKFMLLLENSPYEIEFSAASFRAVGNEASPEEWSAVFRIKLLSFLP